MSESEQAWAERERALNACKKLNVAIEDTEKMLDSIVGSRDHMAAAVEELRGQTTIIKERVNWLIRELDLLRKQFLRKTWPGDST